MREPTYTKNIVLHTYTGTNFDLYLYRQLKAFTFVDRGVFHTVTKRYRDRDTYIYSACVIFICTLLAEFYEESVLLVL